MSAFCKQLTGQVRNLIGKIGWVTRAINGSEKIEGQVRNEQSPSSINVTCKFWIIKSYRQGSASPGSVLVAFPSECVAVLFPWSWHLYKHCLASN